MNINLLNIVRRIAAEQGEGILNDPQRLKSFIKDYAKNESKEERVAFGRCIEAGASDALKTAPDAAERASRKAAIARHLHDTQGLDITRCAEALDILEAALFKPATAAPVSAKKRISPKILIAAGALIVIAAMIARPGWMRFSAKPDTKTILTRCSKTRQIFGIRVEERDGDWVRTGAFLVDERKAKGKDSDAEMISGSMDAADEYPGCPHCGSKGFALHRSGCAKVSCGRGIDKGNGATEITCPWCGVAAVYVNASSFDVSGGSDSAGGSSLHRQTDCRRTGRGDSGRSAMSQAVF
ncbi:MAG: hypothetical protein Pg6C_14790 [Treponemataceae bacterium]|nr:MAG: hypothetical protein Pg6C_14790 [Treponemataceae bacterium]